MKLMSKGGAELRYLAAIMVAAAGFVRAKGDGAIFLALAVFIALAMLRLSGNAASWLELDSQSITARFTLRRSVVIPLSRIAAVEVHHRSWLTKSGQPMTFVTIFRTDTPAIIEIAASSSEALPFLGALAANALRLGLSNVAPFAIPRSQYLVDLLPLVPAIAAVPFLSTTFSWAALAAGAGAFVLHSALGWTRYAALAKRIAANEPPTDSLAEWSRLIRASSR